MMYILALGLKQTFAWYFYLLFSIFIGSPHQIIYIQSDHLLGCCFSWWCRQWSHQRPPWSRSNNLRCRRGTNSFKTAFPISLHRLHLRWAEQKRLEWWPAKPERERPMSVLNVEYITPAARPIWMSHNRCFHVFRSITDLSGRRSSRDGRCRCQRENCRRLWCRLTCQIGPQCHSQKRRQNSTRQTQAWGRRMKTLWFVLFGASPFHNLPPWAACI